MASENSKEAEYKLKQKERARQARKAAYAYQKAKMQERKAAQKADPEFQKAQKLKKAAHKKSNKEFKSKVLNKEKDTKSQSKLQEDVEKTQLKLATSNLQLPSDPFQPKEDDPISTSRPKLRLVVNAKDL